MRFVHEQVALHALRNPESLAVVLPEVAGPAGRLTYGELDRRANQMANVLLSLGVGPEVSVALLAPRGIEAVVAALAIAKAGGCYLPLDPAYPETRLRFALTDSAARVLLSTADVLSTVPALAAVCPRTLLLEGGEPAADAGAPRPAVAADDLAYVIYTSGSTGQPKAVEVPHRGLANLVAWHAAAYGMRPGDRATRLAGSGFDAAVWETWSALTAGATLYVPAGDVLLDPQRLVAWLAEHGITHSFLATPLAEAVLAETWPAATALKVLLTGGDRLHRAPRPGLPFVLANHYGPTEASVVTTQGVVAAAVESAAGRPESPTIGRPIAGLEVQIVVAAGGELRPAGAGEAGELWIGGSGLARGYRGRPEVTAERFVPHPWPHPSAGPGERLYRTGDLVRRLPAGEIDFIGRLDFQVKVRGFRIELGEIEAVLCAQPAVGTGVVLAPEAADGARRLVGYVALRPAARVTAGELRTALARALPEHMVPAAWVFLPSLPLNPNGKVDRAALAQLPIPGAEPASADPGLDPQLDPISERLAAIFGEVLGISTVRGEDDFFALGGHSLRATQVLSRLRAAFGVELAVADLYAHPTVLALGEVVAARLAVAGSAGAECIARRAAEPEVGARRIPLSYGQEDLWFVEHLAPGSAVYNTPMGVDLHGPLDRAALGRALDRLVARHEALRTAFPADQGRPYQQILAAAPVALPLVDLSGYSMAAMAAMVATAADALERQVGRLPMDLEREPAFRALLVRVGRDEHRLLLLFHHIVADDWTLAVVLGELAALYRAAEGGLAEPALQFADFALWQRESLAGPRRDELVGWWRERLAGAVQPLGLPTDRPRPAEASFAGARLTASLPPALVGELGDLARRLDASLFMVLLAAWQTLLGRYAAQDAFLVGSPNAGRNRVELEGVVGLFVNTLALPAELAGTPSGSELIGRVRATTLGAYAHQDLPYQLLVEALRPVHDPSSPGLFQALFVLGNAPQPPRQLAPGLRLALREIEVAAAKVDLSLSIADGDAGDDGDDGTLCHWDYATALFDAATVRRMAGHFATLLAGLVATPERRMAEQPLLTAAERAELVSWHWETARRPPSSRLDDRLDDLFAAQAERTPWATALVVGEERLSYAGLAYRVDRLARRLVERGVGPEVPVALFLPRSADLVVAMLATHAAGGFYIPLDPTYPADRLAFLLADSGAWVLVTDSGFAQTPFATAGLEVVVVDGANGLGDGDADTDLGNDLPLAALVPGKHPAQLAYLIYTSGSTGRPKGVAITHASAALFVRWAAEQFSRRELRGVLAGTSIAFDLSVFEIFVPLATGGTVILAENALALADLPARGEVTLVNTVPSALAELLRQEALPATVETVNLAGEALPRSLADQAYALRPAAPGFKLYNLYGPSEDTTYSTFDLVERTAERAPRIGAPLAGSSAHVVDAAGSPLPVGVPGELLLSGAGLARGYFGRPDLTAERFLPDPFALTPGARLYRTGDLVRRDPSGGLDFLGRLDHQVKVRGYRIELQEIEAALAACPGVGAAAVAVVSVSAAGPVGEKRLAAYFVANGPEGTVPALRRHLAERLPAYMIPAVWVSLAALPRTANGKLDRRALPAPPAEPAPVALYVAPGTPAERTVAEVWAEVLRVPRVGVHDNFFDLGGDSILTIQVVARCRDRGLVLAARQIFRHPTVAELALLAAPVPAAGAPPPEDPVAACSTGEFLAFTEAGLSEEELADLLAELG